MLIVPNLLLLDSIVDFRRHPALGTIGSAGDGVELSVHGVGVVCISV